MLRNDLNYRGSVTVLLILKKMSNDVAFNRSKVIIKKLCRLISHREQTSFHSGMIDNVATKSLLGLTTSNWFFSIDLPRVVLNVQK